MTAPREVLSHYVIDGRKDNGLLSPQTYADHRLLLTSILHLRTRNKAAWIHSDRGVAGCTKVWSPRRADDEAHLRRRRMYRSPPRRLQDEAPTAALQEVTRKATTR
nr:unnamed protein product [Spirometra erinaceieuropaei]